MYNNYPYYEMNNNINRNPNLYDNNYYPEAQDERFFLAPFLVGGLAGTALGYGIANNNQNMQYPQPMFFVPIQQQIPQPCPYMTSTSNNNYYY